MSAQVVKDFFAVLLPLAESNPLLREILRALFPQNVQEICPVPIVFLQGFGGGPIALKWPTVALACVVGCFIGFLSGGHMLCRSVSKSREKGFFAWGFALFWYGFMCLGGFFYHCIDHEPLFRDMDVIGTACSSLSIVAGSTLTNDISCTSRSFLLACFVSVIFAAVYGAEIVREVLYLGPASLALFAGAWFLWRVNVISDARHSEAVRRNIRKWSVMAVLGAITGLGGVFCDKWLCLLFGSNFSMLFWFFWGSNVAIFCFFPIVLPLRSSQPEYAQHKDS